MRVDRSAIRPLKADALFGIERRQIVEEDFIFGQFRILKINRFHLEQGEIAFAFLRRTNLAGDGIAGAHIEPADLRRGDVNVIWTRQIVRARGAQESKPVGENLQDAFAKDQAIFLSLRLQDFKNQLLLAQATGPGDIKLFRRPYSGRQRFFLSIRLNSFLVPHHTNVDNE